MVVIDFILNSRFWTTRVSSSNQNEAINPDSLLYTDELEGEEGLSPESMPYLNFYNTTSLQPGEGLGVIAAVAG